MKRFLCWLFGRRRLEDEAALLAMQAILACPAPAGGPAEVAQQAFDCAEAWIAERRKRLAGKASAPADAPAPALAPHETPCQDATCPEVT